MSSGSANFSATMTTIAAVSSGLLRISRHVTSVTAGDGSGVPQRTRTSDLQVRNLTLYPLSYGHVRDGDMAEREGFEPSEEETPFNGLANRRTRPLCDLSESGADDSIRPFPKPPKARVSARQRLPVIGLSFRPFRPSEAVQRAPLPGGRFAEVAIKRWERRPAPAGRMRWMPCGGGRGVCGCPDRGSPQGANGRSLDGQHSPMRREDEWRREPGRARRSARLRGAQHRC